MISGADTFSCNLTRECRGVTFFDGKVAGRPLHKFFNLNERPETQHAAIDWAKAVRVMDKRDGSLIHTVHAPGSGFWFKSKKSFDSDVALRAAEWSVSRPNLAETCSALSADHTLIFEWTAPESRIVIDYAAPELRLLHVRENASGRYFNSAEVAATAERCGIAAVDEVPLSELPAILDYLGTVEGVEGWVVQFADGDMLKLKTKWYLDRHHCMTALRRRDVAKAVLTEAVDDIRSLLVGSGIDVSPIDAIERQVLDVVRCLRVEVDELHAGTLGMDRKSIALKHREHRLFSLLMHKVSGKEPDVSGYFAKHILDDMFDLTPVATGIWSSRKGAGDDP
jgi:RNA ligase